MLPKKAFFKSGKLKIVCKPSFWVGGVSVKKTMSDAMDTAKDCSYAASVLMVNLLKYFFLEN